MEDELKELINRAKAGDRSAFEDLFKQSYQRVHGWALRMTGNPYDADDVTQDVFVRAFRSLKSFRGDARFSTWLHRITFNSSATLLGRRGKDRQISLDFVEEIVDENTDNDPEFQMQNTAVGARLSRALDNLPERLRNVVVLRDIQGMSHKEIAQSLGITESAAKVRLHRARTRLRSGLASFAPNMVSEHQAEAAADEELEDATQHESEQTAQDPLEEQSENHSKDQLEETARRKPDGGTSHAVEVSNETETPKS